MQCNAGVYIILIGFGYLGDCDRGREYLLMVIERGFGFVSSITEIALPRSL